MASRPIHRYPQLALSLQPPLSSTRSPSFLSYSRPHSRSKARTPTAMVTTMPPLLQFWRERTQPCPATTAATAPIFLLHCCYATSKGGISGAARCTAAMPSLLALIASATTQYQERGKRGCHSRPCCNVAAGGSR